VGTVLLLALAAAVYPQLLAVVVVILTRPAPRPLLWVCYLASLVTSVASSIAIFAIFRSRATIAGASSRGLGAIGYLVLGGVALVLALLLGTRRGRALLSHVTVAPGNHRPVGSAVVANVRGQADRALREGSLVVAGLAGLLLAVPGPFDILAVGHVARGGYGVIVALAAMVGFALIKFLLIEVPIAAYMIDSERTAATVGRFSRWMADNKLIGAAAVVGVVGVLLIGQGLSSLR
jgi:Sap, sulfolipid-1-addressing protein